MPTTAAAVASRTLPKCSPKAELGSSASVEARRRQIHRTSGDFTLFWTGLYPENLRRMHRRQTRDDLLTTSSEANAPMRSLQGSQMKTRAARGLVRRLSDDSNTASMVLGLVRRSWEQGGPESGSTAIWS